ncbi:MAG: restriction endonuclease [Armatimonadetes bacterium]|nr:restriction endonuclease [Armatimonadota bacterium]
MESKVPVIVIKYASGTEQPELRSLLSNSVWINARYNDGVVQQVVQAAKLLLNPPAFQAQIEIPRRQVITISNSYWREAMKALGAAPELLHQVSPHSFENIVGELLQSDGFKVEVTNRTRDGGFDVIAYHETMLGSNLFLVECKKWAPGNPVDVGVVRSVYGVLEMQGASAAAIVTTSRFTSDAMNLAQPFAKRLFLHDFDHLKAWIHKYNQMQSC